jgi:hypothetical protein
MRRVQLDQSRNDCVSIVVGRDWRRSGLLLLALLAVTGLMLLPERGSWASVLAFVLGSLTCITVAALLARAMRVRAHTLVRSSGRLLLDGDPLELARVELRVTQLPLVKVPTGYALSLWVMTLVGPDEVPLGRYRTLLEASLVSGALEDFVQRANVRQPRHV